MSAPFVEPWSNLKNKVVLVTGASSGIGREFCLDLAKAGCRIIAAARRGDRLKSLCDQINNGFVGERSAVAVEMDISSDGRTIERSVQEAWDAFGRIDGLVNNAGIRGTVKPPLDLTEEEWNHAVRTNLTLLALTEDTYLEVAYAASKAGLNTMTKVMALELGAYKIRVNSISPGLFKSEITEKLMEKDWLKNVAEKIVPLKEFGPPTPALTSLLRYLIHDSSEYVSGNIYTVDAGLSLPGIPLMPSL